MSTLSARPSTSRKPSCPSAAPSGVTPEIDEMRMSFFWSTPPNHSLIALPVCSVFGKTSKSSTSLTAYSCGGFFFSLAMPVLLEVKMGVGSRTVTTLTPPYATCVSGLVHMSSWMPMHGPYLNSFCSAVSRVCCSSLCSSWMHRAMLYCTSGCGKTARGS